MRPLNGVVAAKASSRCSGLSSPETAAKASMSASDTWCTRSALWPTLRSSSFSSATGPPPSSAPLLAEAAGLSPRQSRHRETGVAVFVRQEGRQRRRLQPAVAADQLGRVDAAGDEEGVQALARGALQVG